MKRLTTPTPPKTLPKTDLADPSKDGVRRALQDSLQRLRVALEALDAAAVFERPAPEVWSPAEHTLHLITSVNAVAKALTYPRWLLRLRFGKSSGSGSYAELVASYQSRLAAGGRAFGRWVPPSEVPADPDAGKALLLARRQRAEQRLMDGLGGWSEKDLDRLCLPHPLIGKITVREMLFFTRYHNLHHCLRVEERASLEEPSANASEPVDRRARPVGAA